MKVKWKNQKLLVTGGASFIGSHLVDKLLTLGTDVVVADDLSSGRMENLQYKFKKAGKETWGSENLVFYKGDLRMKDFAQKVMKDVGIVFHLAASHGGRGYIQSHPVQCCTNMALDQMVFEEAYRAGVDKICFASSACVYPPYLQEEQGSS